MIALQLSLLSYLGLSVATVMLDNLGQSANIPFFIFVRFAEMRIDSICEQLANADDPSEVRLSGKVTLVKLLQ